MILVRAGQQGWTEGCARADGSGKGTIGAERWLSPSPPVAGDLLPTVPCIGGTSRGARAGLGKLPPIPARRWRGWDETTPGGTLPQ